MSDAQNPRKSSVIVALDVPQAADIEPLVKKIPCEIEWYKVGLELFISEGHKAIQILTDMGKQIFLDLKLHDIPRTVERAVHTASAHNVGLLTVHASGGPAMLRAAAEAAQACDNPPLVVAVTALTSLDQSDLTALGVSRDLKEHARALGRLAIDSGIDGLVCSPHEAAALRGDLGSDPILVTPGIRMPEGDVGDQKRVATPADAVAAGSDFLVVGRPIVQANNPEQAAAKILKQMNETP
ncbi:MAG: orotidine-5'-phosphate decarboxylase [Kiritimatiellia bacterium]|jgi:orotidine-5'-phosphate decarboxylase|nr:orotidine-5'-phosphate decarboxylase [Kiritimatiellia bacterium]MDP6810650.1 orotidine-5'-phosphate decarboxylase [Kiritimatiellia bacterium]MDP7023736.1 orotidine-5'-phosphate decarboxylase [Kiritimatiellia bacterium]